MPESDNPRVLVLTAPVDPTADMVLAQLSADDVPFLRLDSARFPTTLGFTAGIAPHSCWGARLGGQWLDSVKSIYYRRPGGFEFDPAIPPEMITWCEGQAQFGFWGVLESLPATWINSPGAEHLASCKPRQLEHAAAAGLKFPPTMVTNEPEAVTEFAAQHPGGIITKTLYSGMPRTPDGHLTGLVYTNIVPPSRYADPSIALTAHLFQAKLAKSFDLRVTVVGDEVFTTRIANPDELDWRRGDQHNITYRPYQLPDSVLVGVRRLMSSLGLVFGALDFVVTDEEHHFIEINPNGQWAFIENETEQPISRALAAALGKGTT
jgi:hypothetical protein